MNINLIIFTCKQKCIYSTSLHKTACKTGRKSWKYLHGFNSLIFSTGSSLLSTVNSMFTSRLEHLLML